MHHYEKGLGSEVPQNMGNFIYSTYHRQCLCKVSALKKKFSTKNIPRSDYSVKNHELKFNLQYLSTVSEKTHFPKIREN